MIGRLVAMIVKVPEEWLGPLCDLVEKLISKAGNEWHAELLHFLCKKPCWVVPSKIIQIDRTTPFNLTKFLSEGWSIVEEDEHSLALTEVDLANVRFEKDESYTCLDAKVLQVLWEDRSLIPESWKKKRPSYTIFGGTHLQNLEGGRGVLYLFWDNVEWGWGLILT